MLQWFVFFAILVVVFVLLPALIGDDSRDGSDWARHTRI